MERGRSMRAVALMLMLLCGGCSIEGAERLTPVHARIVARAESVPVNGGTPIQVGVVGAKELFDRRPCAVAYGNNRFADAPADCAWAYYPRDQGDYLSNTTVLIMQEALANQPRFRVYDTETLRRSKPRHQLRVLLTEIVDDVEAKKDTQKGAVREIGTLAQMSVPYISVAAIPYVAPVAGLLQAFDLLTGIPTSWDNQDRTGSLTLDVALVDTKTGAIVRSFHVPATFQTELRQVGEDMGIGPGSRRIKASTKEDAIRAAAYSAAERLARELNE